ncbi:exported protein A EppA [Borreliella valaisiana]|uniref:exported protein A EppA n=2 Tax=Borreliella valaisiana TaxID=62088 RepID=UPI003B9F2C72
MLALLFVLNFSLNAYMSEYAEKNYAKAKGSFSKENFNLINNRLNNYDIKSEGAHNKMYFLLCVTPKIKGDLRKIGI